MPDTSKRVLTKQFSCSFYVRKTERVMDITFSWLVHGAFLPPSCPVILGQYFKDVCRGGKPFDLPPARLTQVLHGKPIQASLPLSARMRNLAVTDFDLDTQDGYPSCRR